MISHFPTPYPDELFYSICARFADRVKYPSTQYVIHDLFGTPLLPGSIHLPTHLDHLISVLPPGHPYTADQFIDEHTLFPFYAPFLQLEQPQEIRQAMRLNSGGIHPWNGRAANRQVWPGQLRLCPRCIEADRRRFGECYWHRQHQVLGVDVCSLHANLLLDSKIPLQRCYVLISAEQAVEEIELFRSDVSQDGAFEQHLAIARDVYWLLNQRIEAPGLAALKKRYRLLMIEQGLATYRGMSRFPKLLEKFRDHYTSEFLMQFHSEIIELAGHNWIKGLQDKCRQHPIRHLLLIHAMGCTAETFFNGPWEIAPFGDGPWPCLNPVCEYYRQPRIPHCTTIYYRSKKLPLGRPRGLFTCRCGFAYTRIGPDQVAEDRLHFTQVKSYGSVWDATLRRLWEDPSLTLQAVAQQLGVACTTLRFQAARLGLAFPRPGSRAASSEKYLLHPRHAKVIDPKMLTRYRKEWLSVQQAYPEAGTKFLAKQAGKVYYWLNKYDADWLKAHQPNRKSSSLLFSKRRIDWGQRDAQWASGVEEVALQLMRLRGHPVRITQTAIAKAMGLPPRVFSTSLEKLPLTKKTLINSLEDVEAFSVRRIRWAATLYRQEHYLPTKTQLLRRSGAWKQRNLPAAQQASDEALSMLRGKESSSY